MTQVFFDPAEKKSGVYVVEILPLTVMKKTRRLPPSLNDRVHWAIRNAWVQAFCEQAFYAVKAAKVPGMYRMMLTIENQTTHPTDYDNLAACAKPLIDGMVLTGIIKDDDPEHIVELKLRSQRVLHRKDEKLLLIIEKA